MKAVIYEKYGPAEVLKIQDISKPTLKKNQFLIKVIATSATTADWRMRSMNVPLGFKFLGRLFFGYSKPKQSILGVELAGIICEKNSTSEKFQIGDEVIVHRGALSGSYAEYVAISDSEVISKKPKNISFEEAAVLSFGGLTALHFLGSKIKIEKNQSVLVIGASGSVGTAAVQLAKHYGAIVTAICSSKNEIFVKKLGADFVIDYEKSDIYLLQNKFDKIVDTTGLISPYKIKHLMNDKGELILVSGNLPQMLMGLFINLTTSKKVLAGTFSATSKMLDTLVSLVAANQFRPPVDQVFNLSDIVKAHEYIEQRHKTGNVAIKI